MQREAFTRERRAVPAAADDTGALHFVGCGRPLAGHAVRIVDEAGHEVADRVEGRLEFQGPSATHGYFRNPLQTAKLIHDGWLDTGDRAYGVGGDIYITGRVKDIVIRGGRNLYPQEIEEAVGQVDGVRKGCVAVFGSADPATGTERLVVLAEARPGAATARAARCGVAGGVRHHRRAAGRGGARAAAHRAQDLQRQGAAIGLPRPVRRRAASARRRSRHAARCCAWRWAPAGCGCGARRRAWALRCGAAGRCCCLAVLAPVTWLLIRLAPDPARPGAVPAPRHACCCG